MGRKKLELGDLVSWKTNLKNGSINYGIVVETRFDCAPGGESFFLFTLTQAS